MPRADAIDISHHNEITDPAQVPPFRLAIHKVNEGSVVDSKFRERAPWMQQHFEIWGGYTVLFYKAGWSTIRQQMEYYAREMEPYWGPGMVTQLDIEPWSYSDRPLNADEVEWAQELHRQLMGRDALVYMNPNQMPPTFTEWRSRQPDGPLWLPDYSSDGSEQAQRRRAVIHQWTSTHATPGFRRGIDANEVLDWGVVERLADLQGDTMKALRPAKRAIDTRKTQEGRLHKGQPRRVYVGGHLPTGAQAALVNLTAIRPIGPGYLTAYGSGGKPPTSNVNWATPGVVRANLALVPLTSSGHILVETTSSCHLVVDVQGWS